MRRKRILRTCVTEASYRFTQFLADDFPEIWTQNVNRWGHESFLDRISFFFRKGVRKNLILGFEGSGARAGVLGGIDGRCKNLNYEDSFY